MDYANDDMDYMDADIDMDGGGGIEEGLDDTVMDYDYVEADSDDEAADEEDDDPDIKPIGSDDDTFDDAIIESDDDDSDMEKAVEEDAIRAEDIDDSSSDANDDDEGLSDSSDMVVPDSENEADVDDSSVDDDEDDDDDEDEDTEDDNDDEEEKEDDEDDTNMISPITSTSFARSNHAHASPRSQFVNNDPHTMHSTLFTPQLLKELSTDALTGSTTDEDTLGKHRHTFYQSRELPTPTSVTALCYADQFVTKYEKTRIIAHRVAMLAQGYPSFLDDVTELCQQAKRAVSLATSVGGGNSIGADVRIFTKIAMQEFEQRRIPFMISRRTGRHEIWLRLRDMRLQ
jgi:DNA-directed RNA polymerase subunit K/omega